MSTVGTAVKLARPTLKGERSLESALKERRSVRDYSRRPLTRGELAANRQKTGVWQERFSS